MTDNSNVKLTCSAKGCDKIVITRGLCKKHYRKWLASTATCSVDGCNNGIVTRGLCDKHYKRWQRHGDPLLVCRIICEKVNGQPPMGYLATHSWSKGKLGCVNPHHLRWKTPKGNYEDQMTRGTAAKGERNGRAVLTKEKVEEIRALRGKGLTQREVGYKFGVSDVTIYNIWSGKTWKK